MTTSVPAPVAEFNYTALAPDKAQFVRQKTEQFLELRDRTTDLIAQANHNCIKMGQCLIEIKEELEDGQFLNWLKAFFPKGERTAQEFMRMAENPRSAMIADLGILPTVNRVLSRRSTPEEAVLEIIDLVEKGQKVTVERTIEIARKHRSNQNNTKNSKTSSQAKPSVKAIEVIEAELELSPQTATRPETTPVSPQGEQTYQPQQSERVLREQEIQEPDEVKALPSAQVPQWWRLSGKVQKHLLFCGEPDSPDFLQGLPDLVEIWMGFPPSPDEWISPPKGRVKTAFCHSTTYKEIDLDVIRKLIEDYVDRMTFEGNDAAILAYLPDSPLLLLFDDFGLNCYIAEPNEAQCQVILDTWQKLEGKAEKLENYLLEEVV